MLEMGSFLLHFRGELYTAYKSLSHLEHFRVNNLPGAHLSTFDSSFPGWNLNKFKRER